MSVKQEQFYFWTSARYKKHCARNGIEIPLCIAMINGRQIPYHFCGKSLGPGIAWGDLVYLGKGRIHSIDGVLVRYSGKGRTPPEAAGRQ